MKTNVKARSHFSTNFEIIYAEKDLRSEVYF